MKDIRVRPGRRLVIAMVAEGEHDRQDFKYAISDARKIARSVSAFANAGGGRLLIGVKDNGAIAGVRNEEDIFVVEQAAERYCRPAVDVEFNAYSIDTGKTVIIASIAQADSRPVSVVEADGKPRAYYRVADENIVAHRLMVKAWAHDAPLALTLDSRASALLEAIDKAGAPGLDPDMAAIALGTSRLTAERLIVSMALAGVVTFVYTAGRWMLTRLSEE